ncbi:MAG: hypothetical protein FGF50_10410 [Candidatus Brockarchaeota archaeon]|nr:hypothetical protein [Candidatus Brockarchaeota archaeon]
MNMINESNLRGKLAEKLEQMLGYPFKWDGYGFVAELDEVERDRAYMDRVRRAMELDNPLPELRELWKYDDLLKPVRYVMLRQGLLRVESSNAFYRRFRGIMHAMWDEDSSSRDLDRRIEGEEWEKRFPLTAKFTRAGRESARKKEEETGIEVYFSVGSGYEEVPYPSNYTITPIKFLSECMLPTSPSEQFEEAIKRAEAVRRVWAEWVEERRELCEEMRMDETIFAVRDIVEMELGLPIWSVEVRPGKLGAEVIVDPEYLNCWKQDMKAYPEKVSDWDDMLFQVEFLKNQGLVRVYSSPIFLYGFISRIMLRDLGIQGDDVADKPEGKEAVRKLLSKPKGLRANLLNYFTDRKNLKDIEAVSPTLATVLDNLINYFERKRMEGIENVVLHPIGYSDSPLLIRRINYEDQVCEGDNAVELDVKTTCAVRLDFRDPGSPKVIKLIPSWLSQCLTVYREVKRIMLGEYE